MLAKVISCAVVGLEGAIVEVEVDISPGLPSFTIVGLPDAAVQEARERCLNIATVADIGNPTKILNPHIKPVLQIIYLEGGYVEKTE